MFRLTNATVKVGDASRQASNLLVNLTWLIIVEFFSESTGRGVTNPHKEVDSRHRRVALTDVPSSCTLFIDQPEFKLLRHLNLPSVGDEKLIWPGNHGIRLVGCRDLVPKEVLSIERWSINMMR